MVRPAQFCLIFATNALSTAAVAPCPPLVLVSALRKVRDSQPWCSGSSSFRISAAQNEYESFQLVINLGSGNPSINVTEVSVQFTAGPPAGVAKLNAAGSTLIHRARFIDIATPSDCDGAQGRWPDALVPLVDPWFGEPRNGLPALLGAGGDAALLLFWVDLFIAPHVPAGNYSGQVTVRTEAAASPAVQQTVPLQLRVFGFTLDSTSRVYKTSYGLSTEGVLMGAYGKGWRNHLGQPEQVNLTQLYMQLGLMHRLSFTHGGLPDPALAASPIDWAGFAARWDPYVAGGVDLPFGLQGAAFTSVEVPAQLSAEFYAFAERQGDGWKAKLGSKVCDEPSSPHQWASCASACAAVHTSTPSARCEVTATLEQLREAANASLPGAPRLTEEQVGIFVALINLVQNSAEHCSDFPAWSFKDTRPGYDGWLGGDARRELWMYQSCVSEGCYPGINRSFGCDKVPSHLRWPCESGWPSLMIDAPAIMNRIFPVLGYHYRASGELYWQTNYADTCTRENVVGNCPVDQLPDGAWGMDAWRSQLIMGGNGDGNLLYPGTVDRVGGQTFIPIASVRLKQLRDGLEDHEYLRLLEGAHGRATAMGLLARVVTNAFTYTRDVELYERTREEIGRRVEEALALSPHGAGAKVPQQTASGGSEVYSM